MTEPIRGKVARILNSREMVINVGSDSGVAVGMRFEVMDAKERTSWILTRDNCWVL